MQNLQITNIGSTTIGISWNAPIFTGKVPVTNYSISITDANNRLLPKTCLSSQSNTACIVLSTITSTNYYNLTPYSRYYIQVWANNVFGNSEKEGLSVITDEKGKI